MSNKIAVTPRSDDAGASGHVQLLADEKALIRSTVGLKGSFKLVAPKLADRCIELCCICCVPGYACCISHPNGIMGLCECFEPRGESRAHIAVTDKRIVVRQTFHGNNPGNKTCWWWACCYFVCYKEMDVEEEMEVSFPVEDLLDVRVKIVKGDYQEHMCFCCGRPKMSSEEVVVEMDFVGKVGEYMPDWGFFSANKTPFKTQTVEGYMSVQEARQLQQVLQSVKTSNKQRERGVSCTHQRVFSNASDAMEGVKQVTAFRG